MKKIVFISLILFYLSGYSQTHFSASPTSGCGIVEVEFDNNNPSSGYSPVMAQTTGYSYIWDFGNGETSNSENPDNIIYDTPGTYNVEYSATIDTIGFFLTKVEIFAVGCTDPFGGKPDPFIIIRDGSYNVVYSTEDNEIENQSPPYEWNVNLKLNNPPYFLWVWDADSMDENDNCVNGSEDTPGASTQILLPANNQNGFGTTTREGVNVSLEYKLTFNKQVHTYTDNVEINVSQAPDSPMLSHNTLNLCIGESVPEINASGTNIKWYSDENLEFLIHQENNYTPDFGNNPGTYYYYITQSTPDNSCESEASILTINYSNIPAPIIENYSDKYCVGETMPEINVVGNNIKWYSDQNLENLIHEGNSYVITDTEVGNYSYYITQSNDEETCTSEPAILEFEIISPVSADLDTDNILCFGENSGTIRIENLEGDAPFSFLWSDGSIDQTISNLSAGEYSVVIRDANFCIKVLDAIITEPDEIIVDSYVSSGFCPDHESGSIQISVSGGISPYQFQWSDGSTNQNLQNVNAGTYSVSITDNNNCQKTHSETITKAPDFEIEANLENESCPNYNDGKIEIIVEGGTNPYQYTWSNGNTNNLITDLSAGEYSVTINDFLNCNHITKFQIDNTHNICLVPATVFTPNGDGKNDTWQIKYIEMNPQANVKVFARSGQIVLDVTGYESDWDGTYNGKKLPVGSYIYIIDINDGSEPMRGFVDIIR